MEKWKAEGIEQIVSFSTQGDEYPHHSVFRMKSADQFRQMARDINDANDCFKIIEKFNMLLGWEMGQ